MSRHFPRLLTFVRTLIVFLLLANELSFNWMSRNFFFLMQSTQRKCTCYSYNDSLKDRVLLSSWWLFHLLAKQKQTNVACSSTKVEYRALANTTTKLLWLLWLPQDVGVDYFAMTQSTVTIQMLFKLPIMTSSMSIQNTLKLNITSFAIIRVGSTIYIGNLGDDLKPPNKRRASPLNNILLIYMSQYFI